MAHIVVLGGGIGGVSCAYEFKQAVRKEDRVTLVSNKPRGLAGQSGANI